jgi:hypothetical protein
MPPKQPKKQPAKADNKQQKLPFSAGKNITSDDEKQQTASTVDISKKSSAAKKPQLNEEGEEELDQLEMEDALSNFVGESADKQPEALRTSEVSQIGALLSNPRFGNSESMEGAQGPNATNPQPQPGIQIVSVVVP